MTEIHATDIATFSAGRYRLMRVTAPGIAKACSKDGEVDAPFSAGDVIVTDAVGHVLVSPISLVGGVEIATEIMEGRSRTITDPLLQLKLAAVILAYASAPETPAPPNVPAAVDATAAPTTKCPHCHGTGSHGGAKGGQGYPLCGYCGGSGRVAADADDYAIFHHQV